MWPTCQCDIPVTEVFPSRHLGRHVTS
uniref:Uncharacterized protein n=1 Tax=Arundo donax TaxID=35708 RepID=A0A0A9H742_ARUDO